MELKALREEVLEANLALVRRGLVIFTFGNASGFDAGSGRVVIKPSGVPYEKLSDADKSALVDCLQNADNDLAIVAKHLWQLKEIDYPGKTVLGKDEIRVIASRYNRGPDLTLDEVLRNTSYGDFIVNRIWDKVEDLLATED